MEESGCGCTLSSRTFIHEILAASSCMPNLNLR